MKNLNSFKNDKFIEYCQKFGFKPSDVKSLPIRDEDMVTLVNIISSSNVVDLNTKRAINEAIKQKNINKKKYPGHKEEINAFLCSEFEKFLRFDITNIEFIANVKQYSPNKNQQKDESTLDSI
jgi:hypothetical protein